jgi:hypothetical protein
MKKIIMCLAFLLAAILPVMAEDVSETTLQAEHGSDLSSAPFVARYKFEKENGMSWKSASYEKRKAFLKTWHKQEGERQKISKEIESDKASAKEGVKKSKELEKERSKKLKEETKKERQELLERRKEYQENAKRRKEQIDSLRRKDHDVEKRK